MSSTISVKVLFFASAREAAGGIASAMIDVEYPEGANTNALR
jgi:molybdopterin converting factor small subunit